jgi:two-component system, sensor histidine kinase and response regulator
MENCFSFHAGIIYAIKAHFLQLTSLLFPLALILILTSFFIYLFIKKRRIGLFINSLGNQNKLFTENGLLRILIDNLPDFIYIKDKDSRFIIANKKLAVVTGKKSGEDLIGYTDHDFYPKALADLFRKDEIDVIVSGVPVINRREKGLDENGASIIVSTSKIPFRNENGEIVGIVGIGRDITKQVEFETALEKRNSELRDLNSQLEERQEEILQQQEEMTTQNDVIREERNHLLALINTMPDRIYLKDRQGRFIAANKLVSNVMGVTSPHEVIGKSDFDYYDKELAEKYYQDDQEVMNSGITLINKEEPGLDLQGEIIPVSTTKAPVRDESGNVIGLVGIGRDISKQKETERILLEQSESLQKLNGILEEKQEELHSQATELFAKSENLKRLNKETEDQRDELKKLNATKDKFFSIIAHDLKNPFHSIMGFSDLLFRNFQSIEDDKKLEFLKHIKESSTSAYELLENLLNWARTQTNRIQFTPSYFNANESIQQNVHITRVAMLNKKITLNAPDPALELMVYADYNMVNTILRNLLSNAVKFTHEGGSITISYEITDNQLIIGVKDTGIGLPEDRLSKLFRIDELHNTLGTGGETGTGLGLIISKEFAMIMNGNITVESTLNVGTIFKLALPLKKP